MKTPTGISKQMNGISNLIGKMGLSPDLSKNYYRKAYTFNQINFTAFLIAFLRLVIFLLSARSITLVELVLYFLPVFCCMCMMTSIVIQKYRFPFYFAFCFLPFILTFICIYGHDPGIICFFIPYFSFAFYFLHRKWKIITSFTISVGLFVACGWILIFDEDYTATAKPSAALELLNVLGALLLCYITLRAIKDQDWRYEKELYLKEKELTSARTLLEKSMYRLRDISNVNDRLTSVISDNLRIHILTLKFLLKEGTDKANEVNFLENIKQLGYELNRTSHLFDTLFDLSKLRMRGDYMTIRPMDVRSVAEKVKDHLFGYAARKNIDICIDVENLLILGDNHIVEIVLRNLVSNAIKFTRHMGRISITGRPGRNAYILQVEDNGQGMDPDVRNRILASEGYTTDGTDAEMGIGLGIFICRYLLEKCDGRLDIHSVPGEGTKASMYLLQTGIRGKENRVPV